MKMIEFAKFALIILWTAKPAYLMYLLEKIFYAKNVKIVNFYKSKSSSVLIIAKIMVKIYFFNFKQNHLVLKIYNKINTLI